ncbi:MAG: hypothetical protein AB7S75_04540 [Desulfococcaceae bacterium]
MQAEPEYDISDLNFIRSPNPYIFRRHYSRGLRSHIFRLLASEDASKESKGEIREGIRIFPKARPRKVLRIFKRNFTCLQDVLAETRRYKIMVSFLAPENMAESEEFAVTHLTSSGPKIVLCGLQDYVPGNVLDPWGEIHLGRNSDLFRNMEISADNDLADAFFRKIRNSAGQFISRIRKMVDETGLIPDLAGIGNILLSLSGDFCLVDINNISAVRFGPEIRTDDKNFPVCDKSVEALALMEEKLLGRPPDMSEKLYHTYLSPERKSRVMEIIRKKFLSG